MAEDLLWCARGARQELGFFECAREEGERVGCGQLEMAGVGWGRARPQRASWAWSPRHACESCAGAVGGRV
jgi:hypothetical protein